MKYGKVFAFSLICLSAMLASCVLSDPDKDYLKLLRTATTKTITVLQVVEKQDNPELARKEISALCKGLRDSKDAYDKKHPEAKGKHYEITKDKDVFSDTLSDYQAIYNKLSTMLLKRQLKVSGIIPALADMYGECISDISKTFIYLLQ